MIHAALTGFTSCYGLLLCTCFSEGTSFSTSGRPHALGACHVAACRMAGLTVTTTGLSPARGRQFSGHTSELLGDIPKPTYLDDRDLAASPGPK